MTEVQFEQLKGFLEEELTYDQANPKSIQEAQRKIPHLSQQFLTIFINEKIKLKEIEIHLDQLYAKLYHQYKYPKKGDGLEFEYSLETKGEINIYVEGNEKYTNRCLVVGKQKLQVEFLERSLQNIKDLSWSLKQTMEQKRFFDGE